MCIVNATIMQAQYCVHNRVTQPFGTWNVERNFQFNRPIVQRLSAPTYYICVKNRYEAFQGWICVANRVNTNPRHRTCYMEWALEKPLGFQKGQIPMYIIALALAPPTSTFNQLNLQRNNGSLTAALGRLYWRYLHSTVSLVELQL